MLSELNKAATKLPIILVVDNVRSLHNIGSFFRTADAANIEKIILSELCATPPRTEIEKTALGTTKTVNWQKTPDILISLKELQTRGYTLCALEQTARATDLYTTSVPFPLVLVVGHEREGVRRDVLDICTHHLELPMQGKAAHSLNVSTATAIALYELGRRLWYDGNISG